MVPILDGSSERGALIWSKSGISIFWRHSVTSTLSSNPEKIRQIPILLYMCTTCPELPSYISTMIINILLCIFILNWHGSILVSDENYENRSDLKGIRIRKNKKKLFLSLLSKIKLYSFYGSWAGEDLNMHFIMTTSGIKTIQE